MQACFGGVSGHARTTLLPLLILGAVGCNEKPASTGGLVVIVSSELSTPKDIDRVRIEISRSGSTLLTAERLLGAGDLALPTVFRTTVTDEDAPAKITVVGFKAAEARIERTALTPIPRSRVSELRMPLDYLCDRKVRVDEGGQVVSTCPVQHTCKQGICASWDVPISQLRDVSTATPGTLAGSATDQVDDSGCFDVLGCFAGAQPAAIDSATCSVAAPDGDRVNVALELPAGSAGTCSKTNCWMLLERAEGGWTRDGGRILLPSALCATSTTASPRVVVSTSCASKSPTIAACSEDSLQSSTPARDAAAPFNPPSIGSACLGAGSMSCGQCGVQVRACSNGSWSSWSACITAADACTAGEVEACDDGGVRTCDSTCRWGTCSGGVTPVCSGTVSRPCGRCGTQERHCTAAGQWSGDWQACASEGECAPGTSEACGENGQRSCGGNCRWSECLSTTCVGAAAEPCGNCGTRTRECRDGTWTSWGACSDVGATSCAPGSTQGCGSGGRQTCGGNCQWSDCTGQTCEGASTESCGRCGSRSRQCNNGTWSEWGACNSVGICDPGATQDCGSGGTQACDSATCQWSTCTGQRCDGASTQTCGRCGQQRRLCDNGTWGPWQTCAGETGQCEPSAIESCGNGGTRTCSATCVWSTGCVEPDRNYSTWRIGFPSLTASTDTVIDATTDLEWQRLVPPDSMTVAAALTYCANLQLGGPGRWRLPTLNELFSILESDRYSPAIDTSMFPRTPTQIRFLSATVPVGSTANWGITFGAAGVLGPVDGSGAVRCVRDAVANRTVTPLFTRIDEQVVRDDRTGLIWQADTSQGYMSQLEAIRYCQQLSLGAYTSGWTLPSIQQLMSASHALTDSGFASPLLSGYTWLWSSTISASSGQRHWVVLNGRPESFFQGERTTQYAARCVHRTARSTDGGL